MISSRTIRSRCGLAPPAGASPTHARRHLAAAVVGALSLASCGDDPGPTQATLTATPTPTERSRISVEQAGEATLCDQPFHPTFRFRLTVPVTMRESGGLGADLNFARLSLVRAGVEIERNDVGADSIVRRLGSNRLAARQTLTGELDFYYDAGEFDERRITFDLTDDAGNHHTATLGHLEPLDEMLCGPFPSRAGGSGT